MDNMIIEICACAAVVIFAVLTGFLIATLRTLRSTLKQSKHTLQHTQKELEALSHETQKFMKDASDLTRDIKGKTDSLDFIFRPLARCSKGHHEEASSDKEKITLALEWLLSGVMIFNKFRHK